MSRLSLRLFTKAGARLALTGAIMAGFTYTLDAVGGFADFTMPMSGIDLLLPGVAVTNRIELWDDDVRKYRGYVTEINPSEEEPTQIDVVGYGRSHDLTKIVLDERLQYQDNVDVSSAVADVMAIVRSRHPDIVLEIAYIGVEIESYDARGKTADEALADILSFSSNARYGFDVDSEGRDRFYLRLIPTVPDSPADFTLGLQDSTVISRGIKRSISDMYNVAIVQGGPPKWPQLLPNGSFEVLKRAGGVEGNILTNGGFEDGEDGWNFDNDANVESDDVRTGNGCASIDGIDGSITQEDVTPSITLTENTDYVLSLFYIPEPEFNEANPPEIRVRITWLDSAGDDITGFWDQDFALADRRYYQELNITSRSPGAGNDLSGYRVEIHANAGEFGPNAGINIDDISLVDAGKFYASGWTAKGNDDGVIVKQNWAHRPGYHGRNCLAIYVDGCTGYDPDDSDDPTDETEEGNFVNIWTDPHYQSPVVAGQRYRVSARFKSYFTTEAPCEMMLIIAWKKGSGEENGFHYARFNSASPLPDWVYTETDDVAPSETESAFVYLRAITNGGIKIDTVSFRNAEDETERYLPEGNFTYRFRADELFDEVDNPDEYGSIEQWGVMDGIISQNGITTFEEAEIVARENLRDACLFLPEPRISIKGSKLNPNVWSTIRFVGRGYTAFRATKSQPILVINGSIDGDDLVEEIEITRRKTTDEEILRRLQDTLERPTNDAGIGSSGLGTVAGSPSAGGGGGGTGTPGPAGADGKSVLHGSGAPDDVTDGVDGEYYIDTSSTHVNMYGPKTAGVWGSYVSLRDLVFLGAWSSGVSYLVGDVVLRLGSCYRCEVAHTNHDPDVSPSYWDTLAAKGTDGTNGAAGSPGADGNTIYNGSGVPSGGLGVDGDFYFDTTGSLFYGPKTAGAWGTGTSIVGPAGTSGASFLAPMTPPTLSLLTLNNGGSGSGTVSVQNNPNGIAMTIPGAASGNPYNERQLEMTPPATPYNIAVAAITEIPDVQYFRIGIGWRDTTTNRCVSVHYEFQNSVHYMQLKRSQMLSPSGQNGEAFLSSFPWAVNTVIWWHIFDDGTNIALFVSPDGYGPLRLAHAEHRNTWLAALNKVYFFVSVPNTIPVNPIRTTLLHWG